MNRTNKNKISAAFKALSLIVLSFVIFSIIAAMISLNSGKDMVIDFKKAYSLVNEKEDSIEIAGVGNSNLYSAFSPLDLWNEYGYTSTVCASARQTIEESYCLMQQHFETQKPKLVLIETDMLFDHNPSAENFCKKSYEITDSLSRTNPIFLQQDIESVFSILKNKKPNQPITTHGYRYSSKICKIEYSDYMQETQNFEEIPAANKELMDKLINLCKENNAQILFISIPSISSWNYERHNAASSYAKERGIEFLDFNLLYEKTELDPTQCYRDRGKHLNYYGARAITSYIGEYIKANYAIESLKNNDAYTYWNDNYLHFLDYKSKFETAHLN
ncbi:MAG: hypothetical protein NC397_02310 [Clostridium sp.]|nr:hypothetical protein [Clostridium sp.]